MMSGFTLSVTVIRLNFRYSRMRRGCQERLGLKHKADVLMFENASQILTQYFLLTPLLELTFLKRQ